GIFLLNLYGNAGLVNNQDFPEFATELENGFSDRAFGGSLRQSQINLEGFGPDLAGAHTSANLRFDFAGNTLENTPTRGASRRRALAPRRLPHGLAQPLAPGRAGRAVLRAALSLFARQPRRAGVLLLRKSLGVDATSARRAQDRRVQGFRVSFRRGNSR